MAGVQSPAAFDYTTADLEGYLGSVAGLNVIYRNQMLKALRSEVDEMVKVRAVYDTVVARMEAEGVPLMDAAFRQGFVKLFNENVAADKQLTA